MAPSKQVTGARPVGKPKTTTAAPISKEKVAPLSAERIVDSDSEVESSSSSQSESGITHSKTAAPTSRATKPEIASKLARSSDNKDGSSKAETSSEDESSDEDMQEAKPISQPTPSSRARKQNAGVSNGVKRKAHTGDSDAEDSSSEAEEAEPERKKPRTTDKGTAATPQDSTLPTQDSADYNSPQRSLLVPTAAPKYVPPQGYRLLDMAQNAALQKNELAQKIIWHITAPRGLSLSSLTSLVLDEARAGKPVLNHNNTNYVLTEAGSAEETVLIPSTQGYKRIAQEISKLYTLRPQFTLPKIPARAAARDAGSLAAGNIATAAVTTIRPQPEGLRMRYKPPGFGTGNPGIIGTTSEPDDGLDPDDTIHQFPRAVGPSTDGNGVKLDDGDIKKKKKKKDKIKNKSNQAPNGLSEHVEPQPAVPKQVQKPLNKMSDSMTVPGDATIDDEAARKAARKARKAAKRAAREAGV